MAAKRLTPEEVADRLGITVKSVYRLIHAKRLDASNVSSGDERPRWRIGEDEIERFERKSSSRRGIAPLSA